MKKRIILTVTNDLTYDQRMQRICRSLCKAGYEVELVGRQLDSSIPLKQEPFKQTRLKCFFNKGKLFYIEYNKRLFLHLLFSKFDALCAIDLDTIVPVYLAGKLKNAKLVYDAHEYFTEVPEVIRRQSVKKVWQWVERTFVPKFDLCYTVSKGLSDLFEQQYHRPFHIIRNVPYGNTIAAVEKPEKYILYQGALNEGRGLEHLIEVMQFLNIKLKLAGEGDLSNELRQLAQKFKVTDKVEFLGFVQPRDLDKVTAQAYIGIHTPENKGLSYYYSLANKFFNYIQAGIPLIGVRFPEYLSLNEQFNVAVLIEKPSVNEIKHAVDRLIADNSFYSQLQKNCLAAAGELNWEKEEQKLLSLYDRLLR